MGCNVVRLRRARLQRRDKKRRTRKSHVQSVERFPIQSVSVNDLDSQLLPAPGMFAALAGGSPSRSRSQSIDTPEPPAKRAKKRRAAKDPAFVRAYRPPQ